MIDLSFEDDEPSNVDTENNSVDDDPYDQSFVTADRDDDDIAIDKRVDDNDMTLDSIDDIFADEGGSTVDREMELPPVRDELDDEPSDSHSPVSPRVIM